MTGVLFALLVVCLFITVVGAAGLWVAWQHSQRVNNIIARRLDAESQIEMATLQTLASMREAARQHFRRQS